MPVSLDAQTVERSPQGADGEVRTVLNRAQLEALYSAKLAVFQDRDSGESAFLPG